MMQQQQQQTKQRDLFADREHFEQRLLLKPLSSLQRDWLRLCWRACNGLADVGCECQLHAGCWWLDCRQERLAELLGVSVRSVQRMLAELIELGFVRSVQATPVTDGPARTVTVYAVSLVRFEALPDLDTSTPIGAAIAAGDPFAEIQASRGSSRPCGWSSSAGAVAAGTRPDGGRSKGVRTAGGTTAATGSGSASPDTGRESAVVSLSPHLSPHLSPPCRVAVAPPVVSHDHEHEHELNTHDHEACAVGAGKTPAATPSHQLRTLRDPELVRIVRDSDSAAIAALYADGSSQWGWPDSEDFRISVVALMHYAATQLRPRKSRVAWLIAAIRKQDFRAIATGEHCHWADRVLRATRRQRSPPPITTAGRDLMAAWSVPDSQRRDLDQQLAALHAMSAGR